VITSVLARPRLAAVAPWVSTAARLLVAGVLVAAGALKVIDPQSSVAAVRGYDLLPEALVRPVGWGLPFAELTLGLLLAAGLFIRPVAIAAGVLFTMFVLAVTSAAARGLSIDCGCFGGGGPVAAGETRYTAEIGRDIGLVLLTGWLAWRPESRLALDGRDREDR
jgi:uncharacterized membrane protein YphA (DoxX/SURF4 family)